MKSTEKKTSSRKRQRMSDTTVAAAVNSHRSQKTQPTATKKKLLLHEEAEKREDDHVVNQESTGWEALDAEQNQQLQPQEIKQPQANKLSKHAKSRLKLAKEKAIREAELKPKGLAPATIPEFEQLVLSSPNSSIAWIRYMAFLISLGDVDKAKAVGKRALATINYREDNERFNVYIALLNLECHYNTDDDALSSFIQSALSHTDAKRFYLVAIDCLEENRKHAIAEQLLQEACKKFSDTPEPWLRAFKHQLTQQDGEAAQKTLTRALLSLPKFDHVAFKSKAAVLEYKLGDAERGRSLFENLLHDNPRRLDLWSVYLDQEIAKGGDEQRTRSIFERATHLQLPPKKMKFLFKRYLEYEKKYGDAERVSYVKQRAMEFVERALAGAN